MPIDFSPDAALRYAEAIARPRFVGTGAQAAVADALMRRLASFGYEVSAERFYFSAAVNVAVVLQLLAGLGLLALSLAARELHPAAPALPALGLLGLLVGFNRVLQSAERGALWPAGRQPTSAWARLGAQYAAGNLVATLPGGAGSERPHLYLVAHYDSKSQRLPIAVRLALVILAMGGALLSAGLTLLSLAVPAAGAAAAVAGALALAAGAPLLWMDWGDGSPGAIDNASGVGLVLHLAEQLARRPALAARLRWTILLTSAEELALMGAAAYAEQHLAQLRHSAALGGCYILNFDGVGVAGRLFYDDREQGRTGRLAALVRRAGRDLGRPVPRFGLPGVLFDHMPFARRGLDAVTLLAAGRATWAVHTPNDTVDKLDVQGFEQAGKVAIRVIRLLSET
jgi:hypothetical protein